MSSQAQDAQAPVLEGETRGPSYGAVVPEVAVQRTELPNGIPARAQDTARGQLPGEDRPQSSDVAAAVEVPRLAQMTREGTGTEGSPRTEQSPFLSPELSQGAGDLASQTRLPGVATPEPELYGAAGEQGPAVVRWVARLTVFLMTTATAATGAGGFQERVLEGLGITGTQGTSSPQQTLMSPQLQRQQPTEQQQQRPQQQLETVTQQTPQHRVPQRVYSPDARRNQTQVLNFSPPEELPPSVRIQAPDSSRLFTGDQLLRLRALEAEAPALHRTTMAQDRTSASTASSAVQAEVQRQLQEFMNQHRHEAGDLREQVEQLKREKEELLRIAEARAQYQLPGGDRAMHSQLGDRAMHSQLPGGDRPQHSQLPGGDRPQHSQLPGGDRAQHSQLPGGDRPQHIGLSTRSYLEVIGHSKWKVSRMGGIKAMVQKAKGTKAKHRGVLLNQRRWSSWE